jgi:replicative DNA helicase
MLTALGGGVERGEVIVLGARPSHGKSAIALQCIHTWTGNKRPCFIASEEMSVRLLGKRTIQYVSETPQEHWKHQSVSVEADLKWYAEIMPNAISPNRAAQPKVLLSKSKKRLPSIRSRRLSSITCNCSAPLENRSMSK